MKRWHSREAYRARALQVADAVEPIGLGADIITGFPGETDVDHQNTMRLVEELPFTYLHVFPFSPKDGTAASSLPDPIPQRIAGERSRELRALAQEKHRRHRASRAGRSSLVTLEAQGRRALTGDYLRVDVEGVGGEDCRRLHSGVLRGHEDDLYIELHAANSKPFRAASGMESPVPSYVSSA
jgi:threonylcarbamoyladenosine tRNA methylthiotransferase MtaB